MRDSVERAKQKQTHTHGRGNTRAVEQTTCAKALHSQNQRRASCPLRLYRCMRVYIWHMQPPTQFAGARSHRHARSAAHSLHNAVIESPCYHCVTPHSIYSAPTGFPSKKERNNNARLCAPSHSERTKYILTECGPITARQLINIRSCGTGKSSTGEECKQLKVSQYLKGANGELGLLH